MTRLGMDSITFKPNSKVRIQYEVWLNVPGSTSEDLKRGMNHAMTFKTIEAMEKELTKGPLKNWVINRKYKQTIIEEDL